MTYVVAHGGGGAGEGSRGEVGGTDGGKPVRLVASPDKSISSETVDWSGEPGSAGTIGWSRMAGCAGTAEGLATGPAAATIDGFGYWNTQS